MGCWHASLALSKKQKQVRPATVCLVPREIPIRDIENPCYYHGGADVIAVLGGRIASSHYHFRRVSLVGSDSHCVQFGGVAVAVRFRYVVRLSSADALVDRLRLLSDDQSLNHSR